MSRVGLIWVRSEMSERESNRIVDGVSIGRTLKFDQKDFGAHGDIEM